MSAECSKCGSDLTYRDWPVGECQRCELEAERDALRQEVERLREERDHYLEIANEQPAKWNFNTLMFIAEKLLEVHYPEDIIPTADEDRRDPGPRLVSALRACVEARRAALALGTEDGER